MPYDVDPPHPNAIDAFLAEGQPAAVELPPVDIGPPLPQYDDAVVSAGIRNFVNQGRGATSAMAPAVAPIDDYREPVAMSAAPDAVPPPGAITPAPAARPVVRGPMRRPAGGLDAYYDGLDRSLRPDSGMYPDAIGIMSDAQRRHADGQMSDRDYDRMRHDPNLLGQMQLQHQQNLQQDAFGHQQRQGEIGAELYENVREVEARGAQQDQEWRESEQKRMRLAERAQGQAMFDLDQANRELAATKIDPNRAWKNKDVPQKIFAFLAVAMDGVAKAYGQKGNNALQMLQREVDRDIQLQQADRSNKQGVIANKRSTYGMLRQKLGDEERAAAMLRKHHWDNIGNQVRQLKGAASTEAQRENLEAIEMHAIRSSQEGEQQVLQFGFQQHQAKLMAQQQAAAAAAAAQAKRSQDGWLKKGPKGAQQTFVRLPDGSSGFAPDSKTADRLRQKSASVSRINSISEELQAINGQGAESISPEQRARAATLSNMLTLEVAVAANLGAISKDDKELTDAIIGPNATGLFTMDSQVNSHLGTLRQTGNMALRREYEAANVIPAQRQVTTEGPQYRYRPQGPPPAQTGNVNFKPTQ